ncbi:hypothetical protein [Methylomonas albis]|uniref:SnoaL-like domain-containing protein n=1 Tax=Methylomonas albis TaxID=1854563 RepID=A0ABR9D0Z1_9GAMM|nr:hypothetical protein [Methylomonas albis]MBD9356762.1 hypothetical protein [Methylomonas albis]
MYISIGEIGEDIEKNGHIRKAWSECQREGGRQRRCDIEFRIRYRKSFVGFRSEVELAMTRWMTVPRARALTAKLELGLKKWHREIADLNYQEAAPLRIFGAFVYRGADSTWRIVDVSLSTYMLFSRAQIDSGAR